VIFVVFLMVIGWFFDGEFVVIGVVDFAALFSSLDLGGG
jgi:hypothetical protein